MSSPSPSLSKKEEESAVAVVGAKYKSEKEKMMNGELYLAFEPSLLEERNRAKDLCFRYNQTQDTTARKQVLQQLFNAKSDFDNILIESPFHCDYGYNIQVGGSFYANHGLTILDCNEVVIGSSCLVGPGVVISAASHPVDDPVQRRNGYELTAPIRIGDDVWIGANATITEGVTIGHNVVIGAGAVVTKDVPDNVVVGGVPAKIIREIPSKSSSLKKGQR